MYNQQPAQLDPATQALAQAVSLLKQRANPMTQNGSPTVAAQVMQAAQPQQAAPQGLPGIIANAQQAAPSVAQNAQASQTNQMAQQVAQRMQQQQQPPGVTGLPANNMGFAEGGIVPVEEYAEGGPAWYESLPEGALLRKLSKFLADREKGVSEWEARNTPETIKPNNAAQEAFRGLEALDAGKVNIAPPSAPPQQAPRRPAAAPQAAAKPSGFKMPEYGAGFAPGAGIMSGMPAPAAASSNPDIDSAQALKARLMELNEKRPDFLAQQMAALDADKKARGEEEASQKDRMGFNKLMAVLGGAARGGMGGMGEATTAFNRGVDAQRNAAREAALLDAQMRIKLGELDHARKVGDLTSYIAIDKDIAGIRNQMEQLKVQREGQQMQKYGYDTGASTADKDRAAAMERARLEAASRERTAAMGQGRTENAERLKLYLSDINTPDMKKLAEAVEAAERYKAPNAATMRKQLNDKRAEFARLRGITPQEAAAGDTGAAPGGSAELKYNPKTGKIE